MGDNQSNLCAEYSLIVGMDSQGSDDTHLRTLSNGPGFSEESTEMFIKVNRPVYTQTEFDQGYNAHKRYKKHFTDRYSGWV